MRVKELNSRVKGGKIQLKLIPGAKASQLNNYIIPKLEGYRYDCAIIHVGINYIPWNKNDSDTRQYFRDRKYMSKLQRWQNIQLGYTTIKGDKVNIAQINETLKHLC